MKQHLADQCIYFDLLDARTYLELANSPHNLSAQIEAQPKKEWICIDEIQKLPLLLDEVHRLI